MHPPLIKSLGWKKRSNMLFTRNPRPVIANLFDRQPGNDGISPLAAETKREWFIPSSLPSLIQQTPSAQDCCLPPRLKGWGGGGGDGYNVGFKQTQKGTRRFRANAAKPANLAGVWGWGKDSRADVPFVDLNELAGRSEEGRRAGERRLPGLTSSGLFLPSSQCQVGKLRSSASSERGALCSVRGRECYSKYH